MELCLTGPIPARAERRQSRATVPPCRVAADFPAPRGNRAYPRPRSTATPAWTPRPSPTPDSLGRTLTEVKPDGQSATRYSYASNTTTVTDPAGHRKTYTRDAMDNLIQVTEPNPGGGANLLTTYTYNVTEQAGPGQHDTRHPAPHVHLRRCRPPAGRGRHWTLDDSPKRQR